MLYIGGNTCRVMDNFQDRGVLFAFCINCLSACVRYPLISFFIFISALSKSFPNWGDRRWSRRLITAAQETLLITSPMIQDLLLWVSVILQTKSISSLIHQKCSARPTLFLSSVLCRAVPLLMTGKFRPNSVVFDVRCQTPLIYYRINRYPCCRSPWLKM